MLFRSVFVDDHAVESYSYHALLNPMNQRLNNVITYRYPDDIDECHLLENVLKRVRLVREAKWYREHD